MDAVGARLLCDVDDLVHHQVRLGSRVATQCIRLVGKADVQGIAVRVCVDGYGGNAFVPGCSDDADRDFATVGNQDLGKRAGNGLRRVS